MYAHISHSDPISMWRYWKFFTFPSNESLFLLHDQVSINWPQYLENGQQKSMSMESMVTFHNRTIIRNSFTDENAADNIRTYDPKSVDSLDPDIYTGYRKFYVMKLSAIFSIQLIRNASE